MNKISRRFKKKRSRQMKIAVKMEMYLVDYLSLLGSIRDHKISIRQKRKYGEILRWDKATNVKYLGVLVPYYTPCGRDLSCSLHIGSLAEAIRHDCPPNAHRLFEE